MKKHFFLILIGILTSLFANDEPIGYKVVLSSYSSFSDAKQSLHEHMLTPQEQELYQKYKCTMVARPSGKSYILAIEPLENESDAKHIADFYKIAYKHTIVSRYYGPTAGSIFLDVPKSEPIVETAQNKMPSETLNNQQEVQDESEQKSVPEEDKASALWWMLLGIPLLGAMSGIIMSRFRSR